MCMNVKIMFEQNFFVKTKPPVVNKYVDKVYNTTLGRQ